MSQSEPQALARTPLHVLERAVDALLISAELRGQETRTCTERIIAQQPSSKIVFHHVARALPSRTIVAEKANSHPP
jgi:hypothetical protein